MTMGCASAGARRHGAWAAALALALSGCTVGPNYHPPAAAKIGVPDQYYADIAPGAQAPDEQELATWWAALGDPLLDQLVTMALAANPDIDAAGARLRQARATYKGARASLFPTLTANGSAGRTALLGKGSSLSVATPGLGTGSSIGATSFATSGSYNQFDAGLDASYEVDLFGGVRRSV